MSGFLIYFRPDEGKPGGQQQRAQYLSIVFAGVEDFFNGFNKVTSSETASPNVQTQMNILWSLRICCIFTSKQSTVTQNSLRVCQQRQTRYLCTLAFYKTNHVIYDMKMNPLKIMYRGLQQRI